MTVTQPPFNQSTRGNAVVALGANVTIGNQSLETAVVTAIRKLNVPEFSLVSQSELYVTPCFPEGAGPDYINAAALFQTRLPPGEIISFLHCVEAEMGRERVQRWGRRTMDLDLVFMDDLILPDPQVHAEWRNMPLAQQMRESPDQVILPHPRMHERAFVLIPLADIAPTWQHPVLRQSVTQMLAALPESEKIAVVPLGSAEFTGI